MLYFWGMSGRIRSSFGCKTVKGPVGFCLAFKLVEWPAQTSPPVQHYSSIISYHSSSSNNSNKMPGRRRGQSVPNVYNLHVPVALAAHTSAAQALLVAVIKHLAFSREQCHAPYAQLEKHAQVKRLLLTTDLHLQHKQPYAHA